MKTALLGLLLSVSCVSLTQDKKKLLKILGDEFTELEAQENYPWRPEGDFTYYDSWTLKGDTTGVSNNLEFLMFRDQVVFDKGELFKLARKAWVTGDEWWDFVLWVQDSIFREVIYENANGDISEEIIGEMLNHPDTYINDNEQWQEFDPYQPTINRELFPFDYAFDFYKEIRWDYVLPLITEFYLPPYERYYKIKDFDKRKFIYHLVNGLNSEILGLETPFVPVYPDPYVWAEKSEHSFDLHYNLAKYYTDYAAFNALPVQGVLGTQIKAYLHWKEEQLQQIINENELDYRVRLALPTEEEADKTCDCPNERPNFQTDEVDMNEHWKITNSDYKQFLDWVEDSLLREELYSYYLDENSAELVGEMLFSEDIYYDEASMSWSEFDPSQPFINRELFPFDWGFDWRKKMKPEIYNPLIEKFYDENENFSKHRYVFRYYWEDLNRRANWGEFEWRDNVAGDPYYESTNYFSGRTLDLKNGVRRLEDMSQYVIQERINVYPTVKCQDCNVICKHKHGDVSDAGPDVLLEVCGKCPDFDKAEFEEYDFESNPDALVQGLSYAQALAYYHWKYEMHFNIGKKERLIFYSYFPSEEQFKKVQAGETIPPIQKDIPYASPFFRYVIHVYPK